LPIKADYVGKNIPTSLREQVTVLIEELDGRDAVLLSPAADDPADTAANTAANTAPNTAPNTAADDAARVQR
jgi:pyrimidine operon attenuation protein/uracil phosphoribosyltransferase